MSTLLTRAPRAMMFAVATLFALSLLAPLAAVANSDISIGDQAVINNPNGSGANLRVDITVLDDTTVSTELAQDTPVTIIDGPIVTDTGVWFWVSTGAVDGYVEASLLRKVDAAAEPPAPEAPVAPVVSPLPWMEPIDTAVVVDNNAELPAEGLAVRVSATVDGEIIGRAPVGTSLDVTEQRTWIGEQNFVRVNFNGQGGYVNGTYVVLASEQAAEEPVVEEPVVEEVPTIEAPFIEEPVIEVPTVEVPAVAIPTVEAPVIEVPTVEVPTVEVPAVEVPDIEEPVTEVPAIEAPVQEPATEEVPAEVPAEEIPVEVPTEEIPVEEAPVVEQSAVEVSEESTPVVEAPAATAEVPVIEEPVAEETEVVEPVVEEPAATAEVSAEEVVTDQPATAEAVETEEAVAEAPASSVAAFDPASMIGSATVTGTLDGLRCRVAPDANAATLMVLSEGTTVQVFAEAVNGYLGIDCGGLQGYADVNYLWSGGAGDGEIPNANMTIVVSGTGNGLNCRSGAGLNHPVITVLFDGNTLTTRGAAQGGWTPVVCGGQNGFVSTTWVTVTGGAPTNPAPGNGGGAGTATVVNTGGDGLYCRSGAGTSYSVITILNPGQSVPTRGGAQGGWIPVTCGGQNGFASAEFLSVGGGTSNPTPADPAPAPQPSNPTGTVTVANTGGMGLNCRSGAGTSFPVVSVLSLGQSVSTRSGSVSGWTAVICGGQNGFVSSEFVTSGGSTLTPNNPAPNNPAPAPQPSGMVSGDHAQSTADVNLRYSASLGSGVATVVPTGTVVKITGGASNGFYPVDYDGLGGFMSADYLVKTNAELSKRGGSGNPTTPTNPQPAPGGTATGNALVNYAMNYLGYPYVWATHGPSSFDCSGFTYWVVKNVTGKNIGTGTWTQVSAGTSVSRGNLQPGDLVFFQNTYTAGLSHVGMYIGNNQFIHAQNEETGVVISSLDSQYYSSRWYGAVRVV